MATGDIIAIGVVVFSIALGLLGLFRWIINAAVGALIGVMLLVVLSFFVDNPRFDRLSQGVFRRSTVIPYIRDQVDSLDEMFGDSYPQCIQPEALPKPASKWIVKR